MTSNGATAPPATTESRLRSDTLAASVVILLAMTVAQRVVGFGRGVVFCRWLSPEELGQWDVTFGFLMLAAPLAVLGLPGSFGRYFEYYRQRGQLGTFLKRTSALSAAAGVIAILVLAAAPGAFSRLIYGTSESLRLMLLLAITLGAVIVHNFLVSLFIAVRMYRVVTALQFWQTVGFAALSVVLLGLWHTSCTVVVLAFALGTIGASIISLYWLRALWREGNQPAAESVPHSQFWLKLMPFAAWIWLTNLLSNLFEVTGRYMIIHYSGLEPVEALRQVGNFHSSRIIPLLFISVAVLLASIVTPHLTYDWERGRRDAVSSRLNLVLKMLAMTLFAASIGVLVAAPWLFNGAFHGKFGGGLAVLPVTLTYCIWFGMAAVAQNYLWCAERAGLSSLALLIGLLANIAINLALLPRYGLEGAVWAAAVANVVVVVLVYYFSALKGMQVHLGTWLCTAAPLALCVSTGVSLFVLGALLLAAATTGWVLDPQEKRQLAQTWHSALVRLPLLVGKPALAAPNADATAT